MMTFKQVKEYLKTNDTVLPSVEEGGDMVGQTTLADLKKNMNQNELEMSHLRKKVQRERMEEKAEEVRALKVKQQRIKLQKRKEEEEIKEMMQEVEKRREEELRARIEREAIKKEIKDLDTVFLLRAKLVLEFMGIEWTGRTGRRTKKTTFKNCKGKGTLDGTGK